MQVLAEISGRPGEIRHLDRAAIMQMVRPSSLDGETLYFA